MEARRYRGSRVPQGRKGEREREEEGWIKKVLWWRERKEGGKTGR